ncbi:Radical SAM domain protein [Rhodopirellula maiorica SM1]|uniref:Radical SAM domain protein n=1 Tax=Rhodopirellula maiorica SM1 TaxID=1265738 RepID=M5S0Z8_9BACT|nr:arsenosugar biosynthesis radical SAM (seleno)protein ArsS [Rhodopirellula maiorica]EMI21317.1 Radical SAM domain protein [Rhodopirellula maiorica SM1]
MPQPKTSLQHRGNPLANPTAQLVVLTPPRGAEKFAAKLSESGVKQLASDRIDILQVNIGKLCNMTCSHCHVDAGPDRRENMTRETVDACISVLRDHPQIGTLDLTGGAPEMNPNFKHFVRHAKLLGRHVIDRCNLTILLAKGFTEMPEFLAENQVEIVASLPCYLEENTDAQRGDGAFSKSVQALKRLNDLGYGQPGSGLMLTLVYNPVGASLPPDQQTLEAAYRKELDARFGIQFNRLFTITNMPVSRYLEYLVQTNEFDTYMQKLVDAYNPAAIDGLMCRNTLSVGWDGRLFDCDFNQMLNLEVAAGHPMHIQDFDYDALSKRQIVLGQHCFGCTAGAGSGCQGAIAK